ncbi:MAG: LysR substrate-binding domain-containing protein [Neoaquamicrobium sediminum]|uniref:LysR substrate-binding domain-containing protein n=1 Tax=Neoaquamicrobium sediminum TaxID=1849104 RepID=UPI004035031E
MLVASPSYLGDRDLDCPGQLDGLDGIFSRQDERAWTLSGPDGAVRTVALVPRYVSNEGAAILSAAVAGFGIGALPTFMCEKDLQSGRLVRVAPAWTAGARHHDDHAITARYVAVPAKTLPSPGRGR